VFTLKTKRKEEIKRTLCRCFNYQNCDEILKELYDIGKDLPYQSDFKEKLTYFCALGNEERLKIIEILKLRDRCVCELEAALDKSQSSISHHLRILEGAGLIKGWKRGKFTFYSIEKKQFKQFLNLINEDLTFS